MVGCRAASRNAGPVARCVTAAGDIRSEPACTVTVARAVSGRAGSSSASPPHSENRPACEPPKARTDISIREPSRSNTQGAGATAVSRTAAARKARTRIGLTDVAE